MFRKIRVTSPPHFLQYSYITSCPVLGRCSSWSICCLWWWTTTWWIKPDSLPEFYTPTYGVDYCGFYSVSGSFPPNLDTNTKNKFAETWRWLGLWGSGVVIWRTASLYTEIFKSFHRVPKLYKLLLKDWGDVYRWFFADVGCQKNPLLSKGDKQPHSWEQGPPTPWIEIISKFWRGCHCDCDGAKT